MTSKPRRNWKRVQPTSLRDAMELCKEHALEKHNRSVDLIAEQMGMSDKWTIYKWLESGRIPAVMIPPFEAACGIDLVSRWFAIRTGRILVDVPTGRQLQQTDLLEFNRHFAATHALLTDFYAGKANAAETAAALAAHLEQTAWHRANVAQHAEPELEFGA